MACQWYECTAVAHISCIYPSSSAAAAAAATLSYDISAAKRNMWYCPDCANTATFIDIAREKHLICKHPSAPDSSNEPVDVEWFDTPASSKSAPKDTPKRRNNNIEFSSLVLELMKRAPSQKFRADLIESHVLGDDYIVPEMKGQKGIFAKVDIPPQTIIAIYEGRLRKNNTPKELLIPISNTKLLDVPKTEFGTFTIDASQLYGNEIADNINDYRLDVKNRSSRINNTRSPNVAFDFFWYSNPMGSIHPEAVVKTIREIKKGQELLLDYTDQYWEHVNNTSLPHQFTPHLASSSSSSSSVSLASVAAPVAVASVAYAASSVVVVPVAGAAGVAAAAAAAAAADAAVTDDMLPSQQSKSRNDKKQIVSNGRKKSHTTRVSLVCPGNGELGHPNPIRISRLAKMCSLCGGETCRCWCQDCNSTFDKCTCPCSYCLVRSNWFYVEFQRKELNGYAPSCVINKSPTARKLLQNLLSLENS
jgi:hypothetical protein